MPRSRWGVPPGWKGWQHATPAAPAVVAAICSAGHQPVRAGPMCAAHAGRVTAAAQMLPILTLTGPPCSTPLHTQSTQAVGSVCTICTPAAALDGCHQLDVQRPPITPPPHNANHPHPLMDDCYPAGHSATAGAAGAVLASHFGKGGKDKVAFSIGTEFPGLAPRTYASLTEVSSPLLSSLCDSWQDVLAQPGLHHPPPLPPLVSQARLLCMCTSRCAAPCRTTLSTCNARPAGPALRVTHLACTAPTHTNLAPHCRLWRRSTCLGCWAGCTSGTLWWKGRRWGARWGNGWPRTKASSSPDASSACKAPRQLPAGTMVPAGTCCMAESPAKAMRRCSWRPMASACRDT